MENWHSILRRGLFVASGSPLMRNGAAYGNGIYLSPNPSLSFGYAARSSHWAYAEQEPKQQMTFENGEIKPVEVSEKDFD
jgi:hypothetical protein